MKKFILFIAFLAISIGAVWAEEWPVVGGSNDVSAPSCSTTFIDLSSTSTQIVHVYYPVERFKKTSNGHDDYMVYSVQGVKFYTNNLTSADVTNNLSVAVGFEHVGSVTEDNISNPTAGTASVDNNVLTITLGQTVTFPNLTNINSGYIHMQLTLTLSNVTSSGTNSATWQGCTIDETFLPKTTLSCVRKFPGVTVGSCTYNVYSPEKDGVSPYAELVTFSGKSNYYYVTSSNKSGSDLQFEKYEVLKIPSFITKFSFGGSLDYTVDVKKVVGKPFVNYNPNNDVAFVFPSSITELNDISLKVGNEAHNVAYIFEDNLPSINGVNTYGLLPTLCNTMTRLYLKQGSDDNISSWNEYFSNTPPNRIGYVSDFYMIKMNNAYGDQIIGYDESSNEVNKESDNPSSEDYICISSLPFGSNPLKLKLTGIKYGSHDGSYHNYTKIKLYDGTTSYDGNSTEVSYDLQNTTTFTVTADYVAELEYGNGNPYYGYGDQRDVNNIPVSSLFPSAGALIFKLYKESDGTYNNNKVPYWYYVGNDEHETIQASAPIHVEKEITSKYYRYFSLPFECPVDSIDVRLLDDNGNPSENLELFKWSFDAQGNVTGSTTGDKNAYSSTKDYFIINEYQGQLEGNEGLPHYEILTSGKLDANKGYAFAIVESDANSGKNLKALITFKSKDATNIMYSNTYTEHEIQVTNYNTNENIPQQNKGWNMIGNPFYHYLKPTSFYGTGSEGSRQVKYISLIDDNEYETVHHYWVNTEEHYGNSNPKVNDEINNASTIGWIKPFQAFFVQVDDNTTITIDPSHEGSEYTYTSETQNPGTQSVSRIPAEEEEIQEHLSVKVTGQDGAFDRTTVINDESRDEHFKMMDDLAKIMNPGVQIYTWYDSVPCAFKELPMRADSTMAIPLGVRVEEAGNYTFALDTNLTFFYGAAMLHDKQMNQYHPLNENGVQIALTEGENNTRFEIVVVPSEIPADVETVETSETLDAYVHNGRLVVENIEEGSTLSIYDFSGKMLYNAPAAGDFNYQFSAHGVYMVVLQGNTTGSIKVIY